MTEEDVVGLLDANRALVLALVEVLSQKLTRVGPLLSARDRKEIERRAKKLAARMKKKRETRIKTAGGLILPPGVKR